MSYSRSPSVASFRRLGASDLRASALGLGCMSLSGAYGPSEDLAGEAVVRAALDAGINFLDTADMYGWGHNESLVGRAIAGRRDEVVLATKFGHVRAPSGEIVVNGRPDYAFSACDASLRRLGVDHIDLYYLHRIDPDVPVDETIGAMAELVQKGKVRAIGVSEARPETIRRAHRTYPLTAVQMEYSLLYRTEAEETRATTRELGIAFVAYSPLGRGLLTGAVKSAEDVAGDRRSQHPRFDARNFERNRSLVDRVAAMAKAKGCTTAQLALAYIISQGDDVTAIPGTKSIARLYENIGALSVELTGPELEELAAMIPPEAVAGERYPADLLKNAYR